MKLTIASKIMLVGVVSIVGLIGLSLMRDIQLTKLYEITQQATSNTVPSLSAVGKIRDALKHIDLSVMRYMTAKNDSQRNLLDTELKGYELEARNAIEAYLKNDVSDNKDRELISKAKVTYIKYMQKVWVSRYVNYPSSKQTIDYEKQEIAQTALRDAHNLGLVLSQDLRAVTNYKVALIGEQQREASEAKAKINSISIWLTSLTSIFIIFLVYLIKVNIIKQLGGEPDQVAKYISRVINPDELNIKLEIKKDSSLLSQVHYLVLHDQLTGLPNKLAMSHQIQGFLASTSGSKTPFSMFQIGINGLSDMAEIIGHKVVETISLMIVNRLQSIFPDTYTLISIDVETLGVLLPKVIQPNMLEEYARNVVLAFNSPFLVGKQQVIITVNIGIVAYSEEHQTKENLFEFARLALKHAKLIGENHYQFYEAEFSRQHKVCLEVEGALHHALQNNELDLFYQPQIDISTEQIIGAEALIRWKHPSLGMISPDKFIPIAEKNGSIIEIGDWVLLTAFKAAVAWNIDKITPIRISINLSPRQLSQKDFIPKIESLMKITGCKPEWIKLEITESLLMENTSQTMSILINIADLGIPISMDDFGTGYSSLSYLTTYPISQIKIERSFMNDIPTRLDKCEVVKMIMRIAEIIHADVVAEGVETSEQIEFLRAIKCSVVQGYYYYKPMPFDDFDQIVTKLRLHDELKQAEDNKRQRKRSKVVQFSSHQA